MIKTNSTQKRQVSLCSLRKAKSKNFSTSFGEKKTP